MTIPGPGTRKQTIYATILIFFKSFKTRSNRKVTKVAMKTRYNSSFEMRNDRTIIAMMRNILRHTMNVDQNLLFSTHKSHHLWNHQSTESSRQLNPYSSADYIASQTRGQSNLTKSASRGAHSPVRGRPRGSKVVPLNSWGRVSY